MQPDGWNSLPSSERRALRRDLPLRDLYRLRDHGKLLDGDIIDIVQARFGERLEPFGLNGETVLRLIEKTGAIISGSFVLAILFPGLFSPKDIDFFVSPGGHQILMKHLRAHGYTESAVWDARPRAMMDNDNQAFAIIGGGGESQSLSESDEANKTKTDGSVSEEERDGEDASDGDSEYEQGQGEDDDGHTSGDEETSYEDSDFIAETDNSEDGNSNDGEANDPDKEEDEEEEDEEDEEDEEEEDEEDEEEEDEEDEEEEDEEDEEEEDEEDEEEDEEDWDRDDDEDDEASYDRQDLDDEDYDPDDEGHQVDRYSSAGDNSEGSCGPSDDSGDEWEMNTTDECPPTSPGGTVMDLDSAPCNSEDETKPKTYHRLRGIQRVFEVASPTTGKTINIIESSIETPLAPLPFFHSSIVINYIAFHGLVVLHPGTTVEGIGYKSPEQGAPSKAKAEAAWAKYVGRGFEIVDDVKKLEIMDQHVCRKSFACPGTKRHLMDQGVLHVPFEAFEELDEAELANMRFCEEAKEGWYEWCLARQEQCSGGSPHEAAYMSWTRQYSNMLAGQTD
ncbi:hypothetical protein BKA70DRAFT_1438264 [Coprinopsis sp. MPI-PUGE-AT-0042]|nr:hypothetical protein BKA70DRAFT_1438264 [Coprinopsis sp. MPI-PUGE-AT-0042]